MRARSQLVAGLAAAAAIALSAACTNAPSQAGATTSGPTSGPASAAPAVPGAGASVTAAGADGGGIAPDTRFTVLAASTVTTPSPVKGSDGRTHLDYELLMTNAAPAPFAVESVEVRDASTHTVIQSLSRSALAADLTSLVGTSSSEGTTDPTTTSAPIAPAATSVLWLDVTLPDGAAVPRRLEHHIAGSLQPPGGGAAAPVDMVIGAVDVGTQPAPVLSWPVPAGDWYMSDGCCADDTHHRRGLVPLNGKLLVPQRFAIDFYALDSEHRAWVDDPSQLTSYVSYRKAILASAAGVVVAARDGIPNSTSLPKPPPGPKIDETVGNHVIVQIGPGQYVLYAHMDPGSVAVKVGQQVQSGTQLGLIGTSGNSTVPHLHFQLLSTPTFFPTDSMPFTFDRFELTGRVTERIWDDVMGLQPTGTMPFEAANPGGMRTDEMPLDRSVVSVSGR